MIELRPIGVVHSSRNTIADDLWLKEESYIELTIEYPTDSLAGITDFSHVEILFYMDQIESQKIETAARHPRNNTSWPKVGIFAQRGKNRPNKIGLTICDVLKVEGRKLFVKGLDAVDGTPVLDIKPWMKEFGPRGGVRQPDWVSELMRNYWENSMNCSESNPVSSSVQMLSLRLATIEDLSIFEGWDKEPHVVESDPNDEWDWAVELARFPDWREQLIAEVDGNPIGCIQIIDPKEEQNHYWGDCESNLRAIDILAKITATS